jgi:hypothetical protein
MQFMRGVIGIKIKDTNMHMGFISTQIQIPAN